MDLRRETVKDSSGREVETVSFVYNRDRLYRFIRLMARGLFFLEMNVVWRHPVKIIPISFLKEDISELEKSISDFYLANFSKEDSKGSNKDIFYYDIARHVDEETGALEQIVVSICLFDTYIFISEFPMERNSTE